MLLVRQFTVLYRLFCENHKLNSMKDASKFEMRCGKVNFSIVRCFSAPACKQWSCRAKWSCRADPAEQNDSAEQLSKPSYFFCLCDWVLKRRKNLQKRWKTPKKTKNKTWMSEQKKKRKMKNEMKKTMIFYLTKKSIFSSFFHFVIFALTFMSSLNELMLRTFFIVMYKILDVLNMIDLQTMILQNKMTLQNRFRWTKWFSKTIFKI